MTDSNTENEKHWNNPNNWGDGKCGWYFCKEDTRLWVPKKIKKMGTTINLGHPKGGSTLVMMFMLPVLFITIVLLASVGVQLALHTSEEMPCMVGSSMTTPSAPD